MTAPKKVPDCVWVGHIENPKKHGTCQLCGKRASR